MTVTIPVVRGMLAVVWYVPGRVGQPCYVEAGGRWWEIDYADDAQAHEVERLARRYLRRVYRGWRH